MKILINRSVNKIVYIYNDKITVIKKGEILNIFKKNLETNIVFYNDLETNIIPIKNIMKIYYE